MNNKSICFVLPSSGLAYAGGYKIVYEYANMFYKDGYDVAIFYTFKFPKITSVIRLLKNIYWFFRFIIFRDYKCKRNFNLKKGINEYLLFYSGKKIQNYSNICATAVRTSFMVNDIRTKENIKKYYLIQDYEKWGDITDSYLEESYKLPLKKIVIAEWLKEKVERLGEECSVIHNGLDFDYFNLIKPIEERNPCHICMLNHNDERKRCIDSFSALDIVKEKFPDLVVNIFGLPKRPKSLPSWYRYYQKPDKVTHNNIYNDSAIFIAASKEEGFGLPPAESMICGCALACTENNGFSIFAHNNETALTSPVLNPDALAANIIRLIEDSELRNRLAKQGNEYIKQFTWNRAFKSLKKIIEN